MTTRTFLILFTLLFNLSAQGLVATDCGEIFIDSLVLKERYANFQTKAFENIADQATDDHFVKLGQELLDNNPLLLGYNNMGSKFKVKAVRKTTDHANYPHYRVTYEFLDEAKKLDTDTFSMRSNGQVAFIDSSWRLGKRGNTKLAHRAAFIGDDGITQSVDQTRAVIQTLDDEVTLSRVMTEEEWKLWQKGEVDKIRSFDRSTSAGPENNGSRTYFGLNNFEFANQQPIKINVSRKELEEWEKLGLIEVNTYESREVMRDMGGMGKDAQTSFGLEVEIVVVSPEGQKKLLPFFKKPSKVPKIIYPEVNMHFGMSDIENMRLKSGPEFLDWWDDKVGKRDWTEVGESEVNFLKADEKNIDLKVTVLENWKRLTPEDQRTQIHYYVHSTKRMATFNGFEEAAIQLRIVDQQGSIVGEFDTVEGYIPTP